MSDSERVLFAARKIRHGCADSPATLLVSTRPSRGARLYGHGVVDSAVHVSVSARAQLDARTCGHGVAGSAAKCPPSRAAPSCARTSGHVGPAEGHATAIRVPIGPDKVRRDP